MCVFFVYRSQSGLIYFKDWNSGILTYRDPRQAVPSTAQRIGLLSISLSSENEKAVKSSSNAGEEVGKKFKRTANTAQEEQPAGRAWALTTAQIVSDSDSSDRETTSMSMDETNDQSLELTLNLPGTAIRPSSSNQEDSVCTMEKVRSALERSQWLKPPQHQKKRAACSSGNNISETLFTALSLLSPRPSSSLESNSLGLQYSTCSKSASPSTSHCSSEGFTSPSVMSHQGTVSSQALRLLVSRILTGLCIVCGIVGVNSGSLTILFAFQVTRRRCNSHALAET